jgi:PadR family transcriptional regulator PadR
MADEAALLPGTLDVLILKSVSLAPEHGYGVLLRIEQITGGALLVEQGALYPAAGRRRLKTETERWERLAVAMSRALRAQEA